MQETVAVSLKGRTLLREPFLNKGTAFSLHERKVFALEGRLPPYVETLEKQVERSYEQFSAYKTPLEKHVFLRALQDENRTLFYALLQSHVEEMLPIVYTPTVGDAIEQFSHIYREPRGLIVTEYNYQQLDEILAQYTDTDLAVVTDSEGILGIGDQGFGGIAICMGKLTLYTLTAGIDPSKTLPVLIDVGTNNKNLLADPMYLGVRKPRIRGESYYTVLDAFVTAFKKRFPHALVQWEDFSKSTAFEVLERYKDQICSFNDDIQGTGATALAGLLAATDQGKTLEEHRFLVYGAGAGGLGVAKQIALGLQRLGLTEAEALSRIYVLDSKGLILKDRAGLEEYKLPFARSREEIKDWQYASANPNLLDTIYNAHITALLGLSGQGNSFSEETIEAVLKQTSRPLIFALSNPTYLSEITPYNAICWTDGQAIVATGSPFDPVQWRGKTYVVGQGNNTFIFPGIGWGVEASGATTVTEEMLTSAAFALAAEVSEERLSQGAVFPAISDLAKVTDQVAKAVAEAAVRSGVATLSPEQIAHNLKERDWEPVYRSYILNSDD